MDLQFIAPTKEMAEQMRTLTGGREVRVVPHVFQPRDGHMCPLCRHTHPAVLSCAKAMRAAREIRAGGPAHTRTLDADDPASPAEWEAYWSMVGGIRAAVHHSAETKKLEAAGQRPVSAVGAILGLGGDACR